MNRLLLACAALLCVSPSAAYDSMCSHPDGSDCAEGPDTARNRWTGPGRSRPSHEPEHYQILKDALTRAGLSTSRIRAEIQLPVPTMADSYSPANILLAERMVTRKTTISEMAQLPDFSYTLWDWAEGNENCPLSPYSSGLPCHQFEGHQGALNSSHFVPQSQSYYGRYHYMALERGRQCAAMADRLRNNPEFINVIYSCEQEAMVIEAVGQHYLHDAWALGHMWERWGSPDPAEMPSLRHIKGVAAVAGLIHGAKATVEAHIGTVTADDRMNAPSVTSLWRRPGESVEPGLGDLFWSEAAEKTPALQEGLLNCAAAGLRAVYEATGHVNESLPDPTTDFPESTSQSCWSQRATNASLFGGFGLDIDSLLSGKQTLLIDSVGVEYFIVDLAMCDGCTPEQHEAYQTAMLFEMQNVRGVFEAGRRIDPDGTEAGGPALKPFFHSVKRNSSYVPLLTASLKGLSDPPLPWRPDAGDEEHALALTFSESHSDDICAAIANNSGEFSLESLRARVQDPAVNGERRETACQICESYAERVTRFGTPTGFDSINEPVCALLVTNPDSIRYIYSGASQGAETTRPLVAADWCECTKYYLQVEPVVDRSNGTDGPFRLVGIYIMARDPLTPGAGGVDNVPFTLSINDMEIATARTEAPYGDLYIPLAAGGEGIFNILVSTKESDGQIIEYTDQVTIHDPAPKDCIAICADSGDQQDQCMSCCLTRFGCSN